MSEDLATHLEWVVESLRFGKVVPFLGAGASLCDRPKDAHWQPGSAALVPKTSELVEYLARRYKYPPPPPEQPAPALELARVAQYAAVTHDAGLLGDHLGEIFARDYPPTTLHKFLAALPRTLRQKGYPRRTDPNSRRFVVITTNYDDLLERAFENEGERCHVVWYRAEGKVQREAALFHRPPGGETVRIAIPKEYRGLMSDGDELPIIFKIHGTVDRQGQMSSFVITEDDYIAYLSSLSQEDWLPDPLLEILVSKNLLFLGYSLKDWNLRVILKRIWDAQPEERKSWSIQLPPPDPIDQAFWKNRQVQILYLQLADYVRALAGEIDRLPPAGVTA